MAAGDITLSLSIEGSSTKTIALSSAIRVKAKSEVGIIEDVDWAVEQINEWGTRILDQANRKLLAEATATWTPSSFTAAT